MNPHFQLCVKRPLILINCCCSLKNTIKSDLETFAKDPKLRFLLNIFFTDEVSGQKNIMKK